MRIEAKQRLITSGAVDKQCLTYLIKNKVGGPYLATWKALQTQVPDRALEPFTLAIKQMHDGADEDEALESVHFGASHKEVVRMVKNELAKHQ
jgi:hypothetical protein